MTMIKKCAAAVAMAAALSITNISSATASSSARGFDDWGDWDKEPEVSKGLVYNKCLFRWHDSVQVHSTHWHVTWNRQVLKTRMKKLEHCIRIDVFGPVDIEGMAKSYVKQCINYGLNHHRTRYIIEGIAAIVADAYGTGGSATAAALGDYIKSVRDNTLDCLTDEDKLSEYFAKKIKQEFKARVSKESHWVYWNL